MSGGDFGYLYAKDTAALASGAHNEDLVAVREMLAARGHHDVAAQTDELLRTIRHAHAMIALRQRQLRSVWKAAEWVEGGDWTQDRLEHEIEKYRVRRGG